MSESSHSSSTKAILYAFLANLGIAIAKSIAAVYTASGSMQAEAIHSFADCGNQVLLYIGLKQSEKPADKQHPLGYGKITYFWSFIVQYCCSAWAVCFPSMKAGTSYIAVRH